VLATAAERARVLTPSSTAGVLPTLRFLMYFPIRAKDPPFLSHTAHARETQAQATALVAVAASGLPVDKITIVLGALGVGIGLGLQNIVNNFVSGIILIFDRPLKVGDSIELGGHAGRVKEIGLRSSTVTTIDGADVIIPNGDVLSQHIVNWTHNNPYKRIDIDMEVETTEDKDSLAAMIKTIIQSSEFVLEKREPVVLLEKVKDKGVSLKIYFWCEDFYKSELAKSDVWYKIYQGLKARGMKVS